MVAVWKTDQPLRSVTMTDTMTMTAHLDWLRLRALRESTIVSRRNCLRRLHRSLKQDPLLATSDDLQAWQRTLILTPTGLANETYHVIQFYKWAVDHEIITAMPTNRLVRPKTVRHLPRPIGEDALRQAIVGAPLRIRPWLILAAYAGLRACEVARLQRNEVMERATPPVLIVADGKGGRQRIVPLGPAVIAELRRHGLPSRGAVFPRGDGRPGNNTPQRISALANDYLHSVGIPDTFHSLRHRFGSQAYGLTQDLRLVQELLGHSDPSTTAGYVAWSNLRAQAVIADMDRVLA